MAKKKTARSKKTTKKENKNLYTSLVYKRRAKADQRARKKAEDLATLPKNPVARFFAKLRPDRVFRFWFSRDGLFRFLKIIAAVFLIGIIAIGGLFLYFKKDLANLEPERLADSVTSTINTYLDRNGELLWEDKGDGDYHLVVDGDQISTYMRQATVAGEDRHFYNHVGVDFMALVRAAFVTLTGGTVQGGSTLTQQLIKQVYFSDEAGNRDLTGIPRKIKETILAIEVEKMYDKEQIITMYLNQSPYGGRRNGVESGARTYFGKSAKDLSLAESALLAAIPQNPSVFNPYNTAGNNALLARQHYVLDGMVEMGYITPEQSKEAKDIAILDTILPEISQYKDIKAPWLVLEVKKQLEEKYGVRVMRQGGFTITTTLDLRAQEYAEKAVDLGEQYMYTNGTDNAALVSLDVETSQVIAMVGSADWTKPGFGEVNATTSLLEPASSIKPILDYAPLFMQREGQNWGPGSTLRDENIDWLYCQGNVGRCTVQNANGRTYGNITIRQALAGSLNRPAVKALYINGIEESLKIARDLGDVSYCAEPGNQAGLSMAIGGGCAVRPVEHANAYASIARGGAYKDIVYLLELKNSSGEVIEAWEDKEGKQVIDPQVAYMISDILHDVDARRYIFGTLANSQGFFVPDVWTAIKTGTTENGNGRAKDSWFVNYSPVLSTVVWNGNADGSVMSDSTYAVTQRITGSFVENVHKKVYGPDGKWKSSDAIERPAGIKRLTVNGRSDIWPSWYNDKTSGIEKEQVTIDTQSLMLAGQCTPAYTKKTVTISKTIDPITGKEIFTVSGYSDAKQRDAIVKAWEEDIVDNVHQCDGVELGNFAFATPTEMQIAFTQGGSEIAAYEVKVDGALVTSNLGAGVITATLPEEYTEVRVYIRDKNGYEDTATHKR